VVRKATRGRRRDFVVVDAALMNGTKEDYRPGRTNRTLRDLAELHGFTPGEFSMIRLSEDVKRVVGWMDDVKKGVKPADFPRMSWSDLDDLITRESAALMEQERKYLPFFYATMKAQDVSVSGANGEPLVLQIVRYGDSDTE